jgi:hypothetical protein
MKARFNTKTFILFMFYGFIFFFCLLFLDFEPNNMSSAQSLPDNRSNNMASNKSPKPWSNEILWKNLVENQSRASFSMKINKNLPKFTFTIHGKFKYSEQPQGNFFHPSYIEIKDSSNTKTIQKIENRGRFDNNGVGYDQFDFASIGFVYMIDLNQDGYLDLRILYNAGATGNNWYATFLYDPDMGRFKYHKALSLLSAVTVDEKSKLINTYSRNGWCYEFSEYFRLDKNDSMILKKVEWTEIDNSKEEAGCLKLTAIPRDTKAIDSLGYTFYTTDYDKFRKMLFKKVKVIKKEKITGSLGGKR